MNVTEEAGVQFGSLRAAVVMEPHRTFRRIPLAPHQLTSDITPQKDLFVLAHLGVPRVDVKTWKLELTGLVRQERSLTFDELLRFRKREVQAFHECAGFPRNHRLPTRRISNVIWGGVDLSDVLESVGVLPEARFVWSTGLDHGKYEDVSSPAYTKDLPLDRIATGDVLLAYEVNGEPLDAEHGYPVRLVVPGFYGTNSVKWLARLELAECRANSPFTTLLYNDPVPSGAADARQPVWQVGPESVIVHPAPDTQFNGEPVEIWGWAWADTGVDRVEISTDGGKGWREAELSPRTQRSWQKFRMTWHPPDEQREAVLMARAVDQEGTEQPERDARNAIHSVVITRTG